MGRTSVMCGSPAVHAGYTRQETSSLFRRPLHAAKRHLRPKEERRRISISINICTPSSTLGQNRLEHGKERNMISCVAISLQASCQKQCDSKTRHPYAKQAFIYILALYHGLSKTDQHCNTANRPQIKDQHPKRSTSFRTFSCQAHIDIYQTEQGHENRKQNKNIRINALFHVLQFVFFGLNLSHSLFISAAVLSHATKIQLIAKRTLIKPFNRAIHCHEIDCGLPLIF